MAVLENSSTGQKITLHGRLLVGRSIRADLSLSAREASNEHARIAWDGSQWTLRDLGSRNGTRINNKLLVGQSWRLAVGDKISFGDPKECWLWLKGEAPIASAVREDGSVVEARDGLLLLPNEDNPQASVTAHDGQWELDVGGRTRVVADHEKVQLGSLLFELHLPFVSPESQLTRTVEHKPIASQVGIEFEVSSDEEHVAVSIVTDSASAAMPVRAFNYMLLLLARARKEDQLAGQRDCDAGWVYAQDFSRKLNTRVESFNVDVHRARRNVARLGMLEDPANLVERRRLTGQIRLGIPKIKL